MRSDSTRKKHRQNLFPFLDLKAQCRTIRTEVCQAVQRVMESHHFNSWPEVDPLGKRNRCIHGRQVVIECALGSDALLLSGDAPDSQAASLDALCQH